MRPNCGVPNQGQRMACGQSEIQKDSAYPSEKIEGFIAAR
jgi:hypothetical protein